MKLITAPDEWDDQLGKSVFIAGGITGCPDWHTEIFDLLGDTNLTLLNPRQENFPIDNPAASVAQIEWEFEHLDLADAILFWFPCETLCPIALYELGRWTAVEEFGIGYKPIFVGCHPDYQRLTDVKVQLGLARPEVAVVTDLRVLAGQVMEWGRSK